MKVLFSPIGGTDPIRNCRDGAMLHICRKYKPDIVVLYLSGEMCARHKKDNRYLFCLKKLGEFLNHSFEPIVILKEDLKEVQKFEIFIEEFREILSDIEKKYPDAEYILNVSSGTPAMKSALEILATISEKKYLPIQVSTPVKSINPPEIDEEDFETYWEIDEDNHENYENRCTESKWVHLLDTIKRETIMKQIKSYNYVVAREMADTLGKPLDGDTLSLMDAAVARLQLDHNGITKALRKTNISILPIKEENKRRIFEYILNIEIKLKKKEYADFVRAVTPVILLLFEIALEETAGINYKDFTRIHKNIEKWDESKLRKNLEVKNALTADFPIFRYDVIYSIHILKLLKTFSNNDKIIQLSERLRTVEDSVRNVAAHNIQCISEQWIKSRCGYTPTEIFEFLKKYVKLLPFGIKKEDWDSYNQMNELIIGRMKHQ